MGIFRSSWDRYFCDLATVVSTRGTCDRKQVGCVLVRDNRVLATGYNGALSGEPECDEVGHDLVEAKGEDGKLRPNCVRTVHAESNAIAQAARFGISVDLATAYVNTYPCWPCFRLLVAAGIRRVVFTDSYRPDKRVNEAATRLGIPIVQL